MHNDEKSKCVESSDQSFSLALEVYLEHDLSLHACDILVQEVVDGRGVLSSIFAVGKRRMTEDCGFLLNRILVALFICCTYSQISVILYKLARNTYLGLSSLNILECPYQISSL